MNNLFYLVPVAAVIALLFAYLFFRQMMKESEGNATMKQIAQFVRAILSRAIGLALEPYPWALSR